MRTLSLFTCMACVAITANTALGAIDNWRVIKTGSYTQTANNTEPTAANEWSLFGILQTDNPDDTTSVTISGGGITGDLAFDHEAGSNTWELGFFTTTQAELNAMFPSPDTYTITLNGGTLGNLTQTFTFGAEEYPNTPYLTGNSFLDAANYDPTGDLTLNINSAGPLTENNGLTILGITDLLDEDEFFNQSQFGAATSLTIPGDTLDSNLNVLGIIQVTNAKNVLDSGDFGIDGLTSHNTNLGFPINTTIPEPSTMILCVSGIAVLFTSRLRRPKNNRD